jgi:hypothetical protein
METFRKMVATPVLIKCTQFTRSDINHTLRLSIKYDQYDCRPTSEHQEWTNWTYFCHDIEICAFNNHIFECGTSFHLARLSLLLCKFLFPSVSLKMSSRQNLALKFRGNISMGCLTKLIKYAFRFLIKAIVHIRGRNLYITAGRIGYSYLRRGQ